METRWALWAAFLALCVRLASCSGNPCAGPAAPATMRYLFIADVKDNSPADVKAMAAAYSRWIKSCGDLVVREGQGASITQDPTMFGFKTTPANSFMGDFGAWSDYRKLEDLHACLTKGRQDGSVTAVRSYATRAARIVFPLNTTNGVVAVGGAQGRQECSDRSFAPAKLRVMIAFVLKDPKSVPWANDLHHKLVATNPIKPIRYGTGGTAALGKEEYVWGSGITKTADWGAYNDFASEADVRAFYSPPDVAAARKVRGQLRDLSASVMRVVIPLA